MGRLKVSTPKNQELQAGKGVFGTKINISLGQLPKELLNFIPPVFCIRLFGDSLDPRPHISNRIPSPDAQSPIPRFQNARGAE